MTDMFRKISYIFALLAFAACSGNIDPENDGRPDEGGESNPMAEVPEGVLRIFADKTEISADGNEVVTFTVMFGSQDVSNAKTLQLIREYDGEEKYMSYGSNKFSTVTAGTYKFTAKYYYGGNNFTDNSVLVDARPFFSGEAKEYAQRVLGVYFTSTGCTSCPSATKGIRELQDANPGMISVVAFHSHMGNIADPMTVPETADFNSALGGFDGLPRLFWNMRTGTKLIGPKFTESYTEELTSYAPVCGVAVDATYDAAASEVEVSVGITSNLSSVCRYIIFLVEDGIVGEQSGEKGYTHNNVVRDVLTSATGDKVNDNLPLTVGVEVKVSKTVSLSPEWNVENLRVVAAALFSEDGGYVWTVNNVNECKVGGSSSYIYNE